MNIEPVTESNIQAVWELYQWNMPEFDQFPFDWFRYKILDDPDPDPELSLVAMDSGRPIAFMNAACRRDDGNPVGWLKTWATDGEHRGKGIASMLLKQVEDRFHTLGAKTVHVGQAKPHYLTPGIDAAAYTPAVAFLLRRGFKRTGINFNMDVPLIGRDFTTPDLEAKLADQGIVVRRVEKSEKDSFIARLIEDGWPYSWQYQSAKSCDADPPAAFLAEKGDTFLGFAVYDGVRPAWFGPTGTSQKARGSGIGSILFLKCLEDMQKRGYHTCFICSVGPLYFYSKVANALVTRTWWRMEKGL